MHLGYILLHRAILDNPMWLSETFDRARAWIDLLLLANYKDGYFRVRGVRVNIKRGQVGYSTKSLADRWRWSRGKVNRHLNELEKDKQIVLQKNNVTTLITIVNYDSYQKNKPANDTANETADRQQAGSKQTQTTNIKNNVINGEQIKSRKFSADDLSLAEFIFSKVIEAAPKTKKPDLNLWANTIRLMRVRDNLNHSEIREVFTWANADEFWSTNILSPEKLRKQFAKLHAQLNKNKPAVNKHSNFADRNYAADATPINKIKWLDQ